ncbi:MAG: hypothetical protein ACE5FC_02605 [Myxococcota bacterium]
MVWAKAARQDRREGRSGSRIRVRLRSPDDVLRKLGDTLNRGWVAAPAGLRAKIGARVEVEFSLPAPAPLIRTPGEVVPLTPGLPSQTQPRIVRFQNLTQASKARIDKLVRGYRLTSRPHWPAGAGRRPGERTAPRASRRAAVR